jgi:hypothetical protein
LIAVFHRVPEGKPKSTPREELYGAYVHELRCAVMGTFVEGDYVTYVGPSIEDSSGELLHGYGRLSRGDQGWIVNVGPDGAIWVAWRDSGVFAMSRSEIELLSPET